MPNPATPNLGLVPPTIGGDVGAWGAELNADLSSIDDQLGGVRIVIANSSQNVIPTAPETFVEATGGAAGITITLGSAVTYPRRKITVKMMDTGVGGVTITSIAGNLEGAPSYSLVNQYQVASFVSDGANWWLTYGD